MAERQSALRSLQEVDRMTRRELTLSRLREAISQGQLPPGTHLAEVELSEALAVSRGTLREALRHLQQEGLVQSDTRGRLSVRSVDRREVRDIFSVRGELEALAFKTVCALPERAEIAAEMRRILDEMRAEGGSLSERLEADLDFHDTMCRRSGNEILYSLWLSVRGLARASMTAAGTDSALTNSAYSRHMPIVELLETGEAEQGAAFLREHMREAGERILETMSRQG